MAPQCDNKPDCHSSLIADALLGIILKRRTRCVIHDEHVYGITLLLINPISRFSVSWGSPWACGPGWPGGFIRASYLKSDYLNGCFLCSDNRFSEEHEPSLHTVTGTAPPWLRVGNAEIREFFIVLFMWAHRTADAWSMAFNSIWW